MMMMIGSLKIGIQKTGTQKMVHKKLVFEISVKNQCLKPVFKTSENQLSILVYKNGTQKWYTKMV